MLCDCAVPKKFESSLSYLSINFSVSLDNTKIAQIIVMVEEWHHPVKQVAQHFGITSVRIYQLRAYYRKYGEYLQLKKRGRKSRIISEQLRRKESYDLHHLRPHKPRSQNQNTNTSPYGLQISCVLSHSEPTDGV